MSASSSSDSEFLTQKTDAELAYIFRHPELYHADLMAAARRELSRRGVSLTPPTATEPEPYQAYVAPYEEAEPSLWQRPGLWAALLCALLVGGLLYWSSQQSKAAKQAAADTEAEGPATLVSVETHLIPSFDSLTKAQIEQEMRQLPASARNQDADATRKYKLLAERYWKAENQSTYLFRHVNPAAPDSTLPGQAAQVEEEWRRLTKALVYNHGLTPTLAERMDVMRRASYLRIETLQGMSSRFQAGQPVVDEEIEEQQQTATAMRESLLSREKWNQSLRKGRLL